MYRLRATEPAEALSSQYTFPHVKVSHKGSTQGQRESEHAEKH